MKFVELKKSLSNPAQVYVIEGEDGYLVNHSLFLLKQAIVHDFPEMNYISIDLEDQPNVELVDIISTLPFCAEKRLVVLKNAVLDQKLTDLITKYANEYSVVAIVSPEVKTKNTFTHVDCSPLDSVTLQKWIVKYVQDKGCTITAAAVDLIANICDGKLELVNLELAKICDYCGKDKPITDTIVNQLAIRTENYFSYNLTSAYERGDVSLLMKIIDTLSEADSIQNVFLGLGSYFRRMFYCAVSRDSDEEVAKYLNIKPYAVKKSRETIYKAKDKDKFERDYQRFVLLDSQIKQGEKSPNTAIYSLLLDGIKK